MDASGSPVYALIGSDIPGLTINADGSWSFDPANVAYDDLAKDELKTISVSYSVTDDRGAVDTGTFSINLTGTNDAPEATYTTDLSVLEGASDASGNALLLSGQLSATDVDTDASGLTYTLVADASGNTVDASGNAFSIDGLSLDSDGSFTFDPTNSAYNYLSDGATERITVNYQVADDESGTSSVESFDITVLGTNDLPSLSQVVAQTVYEPGTEDQTYFIAATTLATGIVDVESESFSVKGITVSNGTLSYQEQTSDQEEGWIFTPNKDFNSDQGDVEINYVLDDGNNGFIFAKNIITIAPVNDSPVVITGSVSNLSVLEDSGTTSLGLESVNYDQGGGNDENLQTLSYRITSIPDSSKGSIQYTPQGGTPSTVSTGQIFTDIRDLQSLEFTTAENAEGTTSFSYSVIDSADTTGEGSLEQTISISIKGVNDLPVKKIENAYSIDYANEDLQFTLSEYDLLKAFEDVDLNDQLKVTNLAAKNGLITDTIDSSGGKSWTFTPDANFFGSTEISYIVEDLNGGKIFERISFSIAAINDAPTRDGESRVFDGIEDQDLTLTEDQLLSGFTDVENDDLFIDASGLSIELLDASGNRESIVNEASIESQSDASGNITGLSIKPIKDFFGRLLLNYRVGDGENTTQTNSIIDFSPVNDLPDISQQVKVITPEQTDLNGAKLVDNNGNIITTPQEDSIFTFTVSDLLNGITDVDNTTLTVKSESASNGLLTRTNDTYTFTPDLNYNGDITINFTVSDGVADVATNASFNIAAVNDAPALVNESEKTNFASGTEDVNYSFTEKQLLAGFSDPDDSILSVINVSVEDKNGDQTGALSRQGSTWTFTHQLKTSTVKSPSITKSLILLTTAVRPTHSQFHLLMTHHSLMQTKPLTWQMH